MKLLKSFAKLSVVIVCGKSLLAYLDPGSGSLIIQILVAIVVGLLATVRLWKARFLSLFGIRGHDEDEDEDEVTE